MKRYQLLWLLLKLWLHPRQWKNLDKPFDAVDLLKAFNVPFKLKELVARLREEGLLREYDIADLSQELWYDRFLQSINNPTPEQVAKNKRIATYPASTEITNVAVDKGKKENLLPLESKDEADRAFWSILDSQNPGINRTKDSFDQKAGANYDKAVDAANARLIKDHDHSEKPIQLLPKYGGEAVPVDIRDIFKSPEVPVKKKRKTKKKSK